MDWTLHRFKIGEEDDRVDLQICIGKVEAEALLRVARLMLNRPANSRSAWCGSMGMF
jgi:hypothetical protein